jgi:uncharacterized glyoxalase superfamily protein PhnB
MKALSATIVVHVSNLNHALTYYTTILGFIEDFKLEEYAGLTLGNVCIHLSAPENPGMKKPPGNAHFCIECDDVDTYFDAISKKGAIISVPLGDRYYCMRDFAVNDDDGNTLVFGKSIIPTP